MFTVVARPANANASIFQRGNMKALLAKDFSRPTHLTLFKFLYLFWDNLHRPSNLFWYTPTFQSCKSFQLCQLYCTNVFFKLSGIVSIITFNWLQFISCYKNKCGFRHLKCNISVIKPVPDYFVKIGLHKICTRNWYWTKCDNVKTESKQISMMFLLRERGFKNTIWLN